MKGRILFVLALILILSGNTIAFAHEGDMKVPSTSGLNGNVQAGHSMEGDSQDMEGMDMSGDSHDMEGMDMGGSGHSHGPVVETPPNVKVLGAFGAVNLAFILVGIWNKWFRRRGEI
ncbi:MAG TPA: hypothetical protein VJ546_06225 [Bacillales bacterium]|nr:hypothetical protein [Bacillales bacterium]